MTDSAIDLAAKPVESTDSFSRVSNVCLRIVHPARARFCCRDRGVNCVVRQEPPRDRDATAEF